MNDIIPSPRPRGRPRKEGRAPSANALRHGILSSSPVIPGVEDPGEWEAHLESQLTALNPVGNLEAVLAHRIALNLWRLNRVIGYERHVLQPSHRYITELEAYHADPTSRPGPPDRHFPASSIDDIQRYEVHLHRIFLRDLHELEALQAPPPRPTHAPRPPRSHLTAPIFPKPKIAKRRFKKCPKNRKTHQ